MIGEWCSIRHLTLRCTADLVSFGLSSTNIRWIFTPSCVLCSPPRRCCRSCYRSIVTLIENHFLLSVLFLKDETEDSQVCSAAICWRAYAWNVSCNLLFTVLKNLLSSLVDQILSKPDWWHRNVLFFRYRWFFRLQKWWTQKGLLLMSFGYLPRLLSSQFHSLYMWCLIKQQRTFIVLPWLPMLGETWPWFKARIFSYRATQSLSVGITWQRTF